MPFTINCFVADANDDIVSVDWVYTNDDGAISNTHVLATPAGDFSVSEVTQATLVSWVEEQLQNTAAEFDTAIANAKAQAAYQAGFKKYEREADNTYSIPADEAESSAY
jgi:NAD-dependent oxidoreductase involved in siderophore biosynthesis